MPLGQFPDSLNDCFNIFFPEKWLFPLERESYMLLTPQLDRTHKALNFQSQEHKYSSKNIFKIHW